MKVTITTRHTTHHYLLTIHPALAVIAWIVVDIEGPTEKDAGPITVIILMMDVIVKSTHPLERYSSLITLL